MSGRCRLASAALALAACLLVLVTAAAVVGYGKASSPQPKTTPSQIGYHVQDENWGGSGNPYVYYRAVVQAGASHRQLLDVSAELVARAKQHGAFSRLWVFFYDYPELLWAGPSLGAVRYGPPAKTLADAGDYAIMTYSSYFTQRDWAQRPSHDEVTWWAYRRKLLSQARRHHHDLPSARLDRKTAEHFRLPVAMVRAAVDAVDAWVTPSPGYLPH